MRHVHDSLVPVARNGMRLEKADGNNTVYIEKLYTGGLGPVFSSKAENASLMLVQP